MSFLQNHTAAWETGNAESARRFRLLGSGEPRKVYVASSWRNQIQPEVVARLRAAGHNVYDFRNPKPEEHGFSWSEVNPAWLGWTPEQFIEDLYSGHPAIERGFSNNKAALDWCDTCVCVLPCGRSAHLEAGYAAGQGKLVLFLLQPEAFEPELMYLLGHYCVSSIDELLKTVAEEWVLGEPEAERG
jgi:hypothetical protein